MPFCMLRDARTSNVGASSSGANARSVSISEISFWIWSRCFRREANLFHRKAIKNRFLKLAEKVGGKTPQSNRSAFRAPDLAVLDPGAPRQRDLVSFPEWSFALREIALMISITLRRPVS